MGPPVKQRGRSGSGRRPSGTRSSVDLMTDTINPITVLDWLLGSGSDPAIRWQVQADLTGAPPGEVAAERARVEHEGWGARLLALEGADGLWDGGACFPAGFTGG